MRSIMNRYILPIFTFVLLVCSCNRAEEGTSTEVSFGIQIEELIATYSSQDGGLDNVSGSDLRYIFEIWTTGDNASRIYRSVHTTSIDARSTEFSFRLYSGTYDFLLWADIVPSGSDADYLYLTDQTVNGIPAGLTKVSYAAQLPAGFNDIANQGEYYDAYCGKLLNQQITTDGNNRLNVTLKRPFGKIRLAATDDEPSLAGASSSVTLTVPVHDTYNVKEGTASGNVESRCISGAMYEETLSIDGVETRCHIVGTDYLFCNQNQTVTIDAQVRIKANAEYVKEIKDIPVVMNKLTTAYGQFCTSSPGGAPQLTIEDN